MLTNDEQIMIEGSTVRIREKLICVDDIHNLPRLTSSLQVEGCSSTDWLRIIQGLACLQELRSLLISRKCPRLITSSQLNCQPATHLEQPTIEQTELILLYLPNLQTLRLDSNIHYTENSYRQILETFLKLQHLEMRQPTLKKIGLNNLNIGSRVCLLPRNLPSVTSLMISHNSLGDEGAEVLTKGFPMLLALNISCNRIGFRGIRAICKRFTRLIRLEADENLIRNDEAVFISRSLRRLQFLSIVACGMREQGLIAIASNFPQLQRLRICHVQAASNSVFSIATRLPRLKGLNATSCGLNRRAALTIATNLKELQMLWIEQNSLQDCTNQIIDLVGDIQIVV